MSGRSAMVRQRQKTKNEMDRNKNTNASKESVNDNSTNSGNESASNSNTDVKDFDGRSVVIRDPLRDLKCWKGGNTPPEPWNKLAHDPELWDRKADSLIILAHLGSYIPAPSFRINCNSLRVLDVDYFSMLLSDSTRNSTYSGVANKKKEPRFQHAQHHGTSRYLRSFRQCGSRPKRPSYSSSFDAAWPR